MHLFIYLSICLSICPSVYLFIYHSIIHSCSQSFSQSFIQPFIYRYTRLYMYIYICLHMHIYFCICVYSICTCIMCIYIYRQYVTIWHSDCPSSPLQLRSWLRFSGAGTHHYNIPSASCGVVAAAGLSAAGVVVSACASVRPTSKATMLPTNYLESQWPMILANFVSTVWATLRHGGLWFWANWLSG